MVVKSESKAISTDPLQPAESEGVVIRHNKIGVVQSVNARERIASVRLFEHSSIDCLGDQRLGFFGPISAEIEDFSLYELAQPVPITLHLGDFVLLSSHDESEPAKLTDNFGTFLLQTMFPHLTGMAQVKCWG